MHANYQIGYFLLFSKLKLHKIYLFLILCGLIFTNRSKNCKIRKLYVEICTQISTLGLILQLLTAVVTVG